MDQNAAAPVIDAQNEPPAVMQPALEYDLEKAAAFKASLEAKQNLALALVGGLVAALIGAGLWAVITVATQRQIGWMAVGIGFLVGIAVRKLGKGISKPFGLVGAACAFLGCALGNFLSAIGFVSIQAAEPYIVVLLGVATHPAAAVELMKITASPMDVLFYGIAMLMGYKYSFREITAEELSSLTKPAEVAA